MRKLFIGALSLFASGAVLLAQPVTPPNVHVPKPTVSRGVHIVSVRVEAACGQTVRFVVDIQNNLNKVAHLGSVFVGAANSPGNRPGNPSAEFHNLAPGARLALTLTSHWQTMCSPAEEGGPQCFEIGIVMEPDAAANGEVWDQAWHRVCGKLPKGGLKKGSVFFTDTTFTR